MIFYVLSVLLTILFAGNFSHASPPHQHHGTERGSEIHPADHACEKSGLKNQDLAVITEGRFKDMEVRVLNMSPSGTHHCHVLVGFYEPHIDVLSVIGVLEVEILRKVP